MGRYYGIKVLSGSMDIGSVPKLWRKVTQEWIAENGNGGAAGGAGA